ncbi:hypothetical protein OAT67_07620 [Bacteriovoracaceae bacterium]|nr:hypothetical protein [Bacteriovoracaceae bacterium]
MIKRVLIALMLSKFSLYSLAGLIEDYVYIEGKVKSLDKNFLYLIDVEKRIWKIKRKSISKKILNSQEKFKIRVKADYLEKIN